MAIYRYEYTYVEDGQPFMFGLHGVSEDVAKAVRTALNKVPTLTNVTATRISEQREDVTAPAT